MASTTSFAAYLSIWTVVTWSESRSWWRVSRAFCWAVRVLSSPSWERSVRGFGIGRMKGGWSRVVGKVVTEGEWRLESPICGISANRALWSL